MADPLSATASALAVITATIATTKSLCKLVKSYKGRDKVLGQLQGELEDLDKILSLLAQASDAEGLVIKLLEGPVERCGRVCDEFQKSMEKFVGKSKAGVRDWARMELKRGNIHEFTETVASYKATISVGLGIINMRSSKVSERLLEQYNELIQDTVYNLQLHLQRIDEKMTQLTSKSTGESLVDVDLNDEREVTKQCLLICEDAKSYIEALSGRASSLRSTAELNGTNRVFTAQTQTSQTLNNHRDNFIEIIDQLRLRLESLLRMPDADKNDARLDLQADIEISEQCLSICNIASSVSREKVYRVGEVIAEGESDQVVVNTLADLFEVQKAVSKDGSAQLVGSLTPENLDLLTEKRYASRFGTRAKTQDSVRSEHSTPNSGTLPRQARQNPVVQTGAQEEVLGRRADGKRPKSNEVRRRQMGDAEE